MDKPICHEYIIINSKTQSWHFAYKDNSIIYGVRDENGHWADDTKLLDNVAGDFSVDMDSAGGLHLICLNSKGELIYFVYNGTHWYNKVLAAFPIDRYKLKYLTISCRGKHINVLFAVCPVKNPNIYSIQHNFWNGSKWENFKVARIISESVVEPFYVGYDHAGTIHLVYKAPRLGAQQLYYCKFRSDYSVWSNPERITAVGGRDSHHYALTNNNDTLHLVWSNTVNGVNHIKYLQRTRISYQRAVWKNDSIITDEGADNEQPLFYIIGNTQWVVWIHKGLMLGSFSYDEGKNWTSPVRIDTLLDCRLKIYKIILNKNEYPEVSVSLAYGYERNGDIIIPVIDDVLDSGHPKTGEPSISIDVDEEKIKEYAVEAKNSISKLVEEVGKIEGKKKEIEGMITKHTDEIKQSYSDLEEFKKEVQRLGERLEQIKNENSGIMSSISSWQNKFKEHQRALEEMSNKHIELWEKSKSFSERSLVKKLLDYFK